MNRDFKGVWVDKKLWLRQGLKCTARCFLIEIDSLDKGRGCWAKNQHFAAMFDMSKNRVSEIIKQLAADNLITIWYEKEDGIETRFLRLLLPVEKSTSLSKNRLHLSKNRLHLSKNRLPNNRTEYNNENNNEIYVKAFSFLEENYPSRVEKFMMDYGGKIKDLAGFIKFFNNQADEKELKYSQRILFGRLNNLADTWLVNQNKNNSHQVEQSVSKLIGKRLV